MECDEVRETIYVYLDGELETDQAKALQRHLLQCPICSEEAADVRRFYTATRPLPSVRLPEDFTAATVRKAVLRTEGIGLGEWLRNLTWPWRWATCAVTLAGVIIGGISYQMTVYDQDLIAAQSETRFLTSDASLSDSYVLAVWEGDEP